MIEQTLAVNGPRRRGTGAHFLISTQNLDFGVSKPSRVLSLSVTLTNQGAPFYGTMSLELLGGDDLFRTVFSTRESDDSVRIVVELNTYVQSLSQLGTHTEVLTINVNNQTFMVQVKGEIIPHTHE
jgi:hypothetical protein